TRNASTFNAFSASPVACSRAPPPASASPAPPSFTKCGAWASARREPKARRSSTQQQRVHNFFCSTGLACVVRFRVKALSRQVELLLVQQRIALDDYGAAQNLLQLRKIVVLVGFQHLRHFRRYAQHHVLAFHGARNLV